MPTHYLVDRFHAEKRRGCQAFQLPEPEWVRYVAIRFLSQHTNELICAVSEVGVYGKTATQDLEDQLISSNGAAGDSAPPDRDAAKDGTSAEADGASADPVAPAFSESERNATPQLDVAAEAVPDAAPTPIPLQRANEPVVGTDAPRMKPPPVASVPPRSAPEKVNGAAPEVVKSDGHKDVPLPSGGSSRPSSMYDQLIQQLKEMKVQQARLQSAHEELLESTASRIDVLVKAQAALAEQLREMQGVLGEVVGEAKRARRNNGAGFFWWGGAREAANASAKKDD